MNKSDTSRINLYANTICVLIEQFTSPEERMDFDTILAVWLTP